MKVLFVKKIVSIVSTSLLVAFVLSFDFLVQYEEQLPDIFFIFGFLVGGLQFLMLVDCIINAFSRTIGNKRIYLIVGLIFLLWLSVPFYYWFFYRLEKDSEPEIGTNQRT